MKWKPALFGAIAVAVVIAVAMLDRIPQDARYFDFADQRSFAGIPNFLNVISNLPFIIVGLMGWRWLATNSAHISASTQRAWWIFFLGISLTAFGSGYFHWVPNNDTLVWDRLPMTIGFMSLASIIVSEYFSPRWGARVLMPLLIVGVSSVAYWAITEARGFGDLRPYAVVQFLPMLLIPLVLLLYRSRSDLGRYVWWMVGFYVAAKFAEHFDHHLYAIGGMVSGHSVKHLLASLAPASMLYGLARRLREGKPVRG